MSEQGKPTFFDVDTYLDAVEMMINADEVERAFVMLDNMPGFYRDHVPQRAATIKTILHKRLFTPVQYAGHYGSGELIIDTETIMKSWPTRATLVEKLVLRLNSKGIKPNIMEYAPGSFWLPFGLKEKGCDVSYEYRSLDRIDDKHFRVSDNSVFNIFCAFEVIEHLWKEEEIFQNYLKFDKPAHVVFISTPLYTINGGEPNWHVRDLGHLRTYTPKEFDKVVSDMFPGYEWSMFSDACMHLIGRHKKLLSPDQVTLFDEFLKTIV